MTTKEKLIKCERDLMHLIIDLGQYAAWSSVIETLSHAHDELVEQIEDMEEK